MDDIVPELYKKIKSEFDGLVSSDEEIQAILNDEKVGTFAELYPMSKRVGQYAAKSLSNHYTEELLPDGILYWNIMESTIMPVMKNIHKIDNQLAFNVQKKLDAAQKIGIKPQESDFPEERVNSVMNMLSTLTNDNKTDLQRASQILTRSVVNISNSIIDNFIQKNAEFRANAGMTAKIIRTSSGHCCEWCNEIAGTYKYPDVPKDVYRRHDNCDCTVEYVCGKVKNIVHSGTEGKRKYVQDEYGNYKLTKEARIDKAKQMAATEEERKKIAREKRIATWDRKKNEKINTFVKTEKGYAEGGFVRIGNNIVDLSYIHSIEYKEKFSRISNNKELNNAIYSRAVNLLTRNNGTDTEGLYILNRNGKTILNINGLKNQLGVSLSDKEISIIRNYNYKIGIHNHPTNLLPNGSDFVAAGYRRYDFGIVVTHDGKIYKYSVGNKYFTPGLLDKRIDKYINGGYNLSIEDAYIKALNEFREEYGIKWQEVN